MKELADGTPITVSWDTKRNTSRAVVVCRELAIDTEDDIRTNLSTQGVTEVKHISRMSDDKKTKFNTGVVILTFSQPSPPEKLKIGYRVCRTEKYYPRPTQCYRCYEYQHISKFCKKEERCRTCGEKAHLESDECSKEIKCINCDDNHISTSKACPIFRQEQQIIKIKTDKNISYTAARKQLINNNEKPSYAKVTGDVQTIVENARKQWEKELEEKMSFISEKMKVISERMEALNEKEANIKNWYNYLKYKEKNLKITEEKMQKDIEEMKTHCGKLTNELQKKDELIEKLTKNIESQTQKTITTKDKHGKKIKCDKPIESSPDRETREGTPRRKSNRINNKNNNKQRKTDSSDMETEELNDDN
ncbi:uncharacterized protein LOC134211883 [Armigeres subalbatus]|uniref:uncharacterized protein LOC134211883 n=1 Tax=Armigeres subalbatus TaxID=124917 RepID=UPI002ED5AAA9